jgi:hypothetical protein
MLAWFAKSKDELHFATLPKMYSGLIVATSALLSTLSHAQQLISDPGVKGPPLELVHLYNDQWPTGTLKDCTF